MPSSSHRSAARRLADAALRPIGLAVADRTLVRRARRTTWVGALEHLRSRGIAPRTVIDVGVADGTPALYEAFPDARHVLVEPLVEALPHVRAIVDRYERVEHIAAAAASRPGTVVLNVPPDIHRASRYESSAPGRSSFERREVPAVTVDEVRRERGLEAPLLLKLDVEGGELDVLRGAEDTLAHTAYVILETSLFQFYRGAPLLADVIAFMHARGFVVYDVLSVQHRPIDDAASMLDLAFVPSESPLRTEHRFEGPVGDDGVQGDGTAEVSG